MERLINGGVDFVVEVNVFELERAKSGGGEGKDVVAIGVPGRRLVGVKRVGSLRQGVPAVGASLLLGDRTAH